MLELGICVHLYLLRIMQKFTQVDVLPLHSESVIATAQSFKEACKGHEPKAGAQPKRVKLRAMLCGTGESVHGDRTCIPASSAPLGSMPSCRFDFGFVRTSSGSKITH